MNASLRKGSGTLKNDVSKILPRSSCQWYCLLGVLTLDCAHSWGSWFVPHLFPYLSPRQVTVWSWQGNNQTIPGQPTQPTSWTVRGAQGTLRRQYGSEPELIQSAFRRPSAERISTWKTLWQAEDFAASTKSQIAVRCHWANWNQEKPNASTAFNRHLTISTYHRVVSQLVVLTFTF